MLKPPILIILLLVVSTVAVFGVAGCRSGTRSGSGRSSAQTAQLAELVESLEQAAFFQYTPEDAREGTKREILETGYLFADSLGRWYRADAEDLAEQGVMRFLAEIAPFLETQGVSLPYRTEPGKSRLMRNPQTGEAEEISPARILIDDTLPDQPGRPYLKPVQEHLAQGTRYAVTIGDITQEIWNDRLGEDEYWEASMNNAFILVNRLLEQAGSSERVYGEYGGNDGAAIFLTPRQFELIRQSDAINLADKPWMPHEFKGE